MRIFSKVSRSGSKPFRIVLETSESAIAMTTEQSTHASGSMAVVDTRSSHLSFTDATFAVLALLHLVKLFKRQTVGKSEMVAFPSRIHASTHDESVPFVSFSGDFFDARILSALLLVRRKVSFVLRGPFRMTCYLGFLVFSVILSIVGDAPFAPFLIGQYRDKRLLASRAIRTCACAFQVFVRRASWARLVPPVLRRFKKVSAASARWQCHNDILSQRQLHANFL